jgi:hypothetical protein
MATLTRPNRTGPLAAILRDLSALQQLRIDAVPSACRLANGGLDEREWSQFVPGLPYRPTCPR